MVQKLWILDPKIKISSPLQTTNLWSEFQTWFLNSMMFKSCLVCFKDSKKPPHMEAPESWGWLFPQCAVSRGSNDLFNQPSCLAAETEPNGVRSHICNGLKKPFLVSQNGFCQSKRDRTEGNSWSFKRD